MRLDEDCWRVVIFFCRHDRGTLFNTLRVSKMFFLISVKYLYYNPFGVGERNPRYKPLTAARTRYLERLVSLSSGHAKAVGIPMAIPLLTPSSCATNAAATKNNNIDHQNTDSDNNNGSSSSSSSSSTSSSGGSSTNGVHKSNTVIRPTLRSKNRQLKKFDPDSLTLPLAFDYFGHLTILPAQPWYPYPQNQYDAQTTLMKGVLTHLEYHGPKFTNLMISYQAINTIADLCLPCGESSKLSKLERLHTVFFVRAYGAFGQISVVATPEEFEAMKLWVNEFQKARPGRGEQLKHIRMIHQGDNCEHYRELIGMLENPEVLDLCVRGREKDNVLTMSMDEFPAKGIKHLKIRMKANIPIPRSMNLTEYLKKARQLEKVDLVQYSDDIFEWAVKEREAQQLQSSQGKSTNHAIPNRLAPLTTFIACGTFQPLMDVMSAFRSTLEALEFTRAQTSQDHPDSKTPVFLDWDFDLPKLTMLDLHDQAINIECIRRHCQGLEHLQIRSNAMTLFPRPSDYLLPSKAAASAPWATFNWIRHLHLKGPVHDQILVESIRELVHLEYLRSENNPVSQRPLAGTAAAQSAWTRARAQRRAMAQQGPIRAIDMSWPFVENNDTIGTETKRWWFPNLKQVRLEGAWAVALQQIATVSPVLETFWLSISPPDRWMLELDPFQVADRMMTKGNNFKLLSLALVGWTVDVRHGGLMNLRHGLVQFFPRLQELVFRDLKYLKHPDHVPDPNGGGLNDGTGRAGDVVFRACSGVAKVGGLVSEEQQWMEEDDDSLYWLKPLKVDCLVQAAVTHISGLKKLHLTRADCLAANQLEECLPGFEESKDDGGYSSVVDPDAWIESEEGTIDRPVIGDKRGCMVVYQGKTYRRPKKKVSFASELTPPICDRRHFYERKKKK